VPAFALNNLLSSYVTLLGTLLTTAAGWRPVAISTSCIARSTTSRPPQHDVGGDAGGDCANIFNAPPTPLAGDDAGAR